MLPDWPAQGWYPKALEMLKQEPIYLKARRGPTPVTKSSRGSTPSLAQTEPPSLSLIRESLGKYNLSSSAKDVLMASWREGTSKQYYTYLKRWRQYCDDKDIDLFQPGVHNGVEFLVSLYKAGLGYSAVNTARSALSSPLILENNEEFGDHPLVVRGMKGIFELKPSLPKYNEIWDVRVVLDYLKTFGASIALLLKELTLKLTMLLCLTTGQRGQTIHKFDINDIQDLDDRYRISVHEKLKQTKLGRHLEPIELLAFPENKELCVVQHLREYIHLTDPLRKDHSQLLLSYVKPFKPVARDTVSRWVKQVLQSAGIDITKYSAHSCRAASTSNVKVKGLNIAEIIKCAGWSTASTFARFYDKPVSNTSANLGSVLLNPDAR